MYGGKNNPQKAVKKMKTVPEERRFTQDHIWVKMEDDFIGRCGITDERQEALGIVVFVDFPEISMEVRAGERIALLESDIDYFTVVSPVSGMITDVNLALETVPGMINTDPYGEGWIYKIEVKEASEFRDLMDEKEYRDYLLSG